MRNLLERTGRGVDGGGSRSDSGHGFRGGYDEQRRHQGARADGDVLPGVEGRVPRGPMSSCCSGGEHELAEGWSRRHCREEQERGASVSKSAAPRLRLGYASGAKSKSAGGATVTLRPHLGYT